MQKKIAFLSLALILLIGLCFLVYFKSRATSAGENPLQKYSADQITKVSLESTGGNMAMEKKEAGWELTAPFNDRLDGPSVETIITTLQSFKLGPVISENKDKYEQFDLTPERAIHAKVFIDAKSEAVFDAYIGKMAAAFTDSYIRFEGKKGVYLGNNLPSYFLRRQADDLRLRSWSDLTVDEVQTFSMTSGKSSISLSRSSDTWTDTAANKTVDAAWAKGLVEQTLGWRVVDFGKGDEKPEALGFDKPYVKISAANAGSKISVIAVGNKTADKPPKRYAKADDRAAVFLISADIIDKAVADLKKRP